MEIKDVEVMSIKGTQNLIIIIELSNDNKFLCIEGMTKTLLSLKEDGPSECAMLPIWENKNCSPLSS